MKKGRKVILIIDICLLAITLAFIWVNSFIKAESSAEGSSGIYELLSGVFDFIFGKGVITHEIFRKIIHGTEFFILGLELNLLFVLIKKYNIQCICATLSIGLFVAVIDESIQIISGRGPMVKDVLIDFGGIFAITLIFAVIFYIIKSIKQTKKR